MSKIRLYRLTGESEELEKRIANYMNVICRMNTTFVFNKNASELRSIFNS